MLEAGGHRRLLAPGRGAPQPEEDLGEDLGAYLFGHVSEKKRNLPSKTAYLSSALWNII